MAVLVTDSDEEKCVVEGEMKKGDDEAWTRQLSLEMSGEETKCSKVEMTLQVVVHCVSDVKVERSNKLSLALGLSPRVRVGVTLARDGQLIVSDSTMLSVLDAGSAYFSQDGHTIEFPAPYSLFSNGATLAWTLFLEDEARLLGCCLGPNFDEDQPLSSSGANPITSHHGDAAHWIDGQPHDHYLDNGAIITISASFLSESFFQHPNPRTALPPLPSGDP